MQSQYLRYPRRRRRIDWLYCLTMAGIAAAYILLAFSLIRFGMTFAGAKESPETAATVVTDAPHKPIQPPQTSGIDTYTPAIETAAESVTEAITTAFEPELIPEPQTPAVVYYDIPLSHALQDYTREVCEQYGCPFELALAVMSVESDYRNIKSDNGRDIGLMQINKVNHGWLAKDYGLTDMMNPEMNIAAGVIMLGGYLKKYCGYNETLMAYHDGEYGALRQWAGGIYSTEYTVRVMERLGELND